MGLLFVVCAIKQKNANFCHDCQFEQTDNISKTNLEFWVPIEIQNRKTIMEQLEASERFIDS